MRNQSAIHRTKGSGKVRPRKQNPLRSSDSHSVATMRPDSPMTPAFTVAYDANGNTLSDPSGKSYSWDFENRLVQAVVPGTNGGTTTFKYDPFGGRRIQKSGPFGTTNS